MSEIDKKALITTRPGTLEDINFVYATWLKGLRYGNDWFLLIDQDVYFKHYHDVIETILSRPNTAIRVACLVEDPSVIIGYSVYEGPVVHWAFVKKPWRKIGICKDLMPSRITTVTHLTRTGASLLTKSPGVRFNPFVA